MQPFSNLLLFAALAACLSYTFHLHQQLEAAEARAVMCEALYNKTIAKTVSLELLRERHPTNFDWIDQQRRDDILHPPIETADDSVSLLRENWQKYLDTHTPLVWQGESSKLSCESAADVVVSLEDLEADEDAVEKARMALKECGFVYLDNLLERRQVEEFRDAFEAFRATEEGKRFRYPCQGKGRIEHMVPFRPPFNTSHLYANKYLLKIIQRFLNAKIKLELITVIDSPPGSGDQRWHQGWSYLFHEEERLPPYR